LATPPKLHGLVCSNETVGVTVMVGVGVGVKPVIEAFTETPPQTFVELGVIVTVGVTVIVGVTVGVTGTSQSKIASKSIKQEGAEVGLGVGVTQIPEYR
jgi:hypothetical protein